MYKLPIVVVMYLALTTGATAVASTASQTPKAVIEASAQTLLAIADAEIYEYRDSARLQTDVAKVMDAHVDWEAVARLVLGKHWRSADDSDRRRFIEQFRRLLVRTYTRALDSADRPSFQVLDSRQGEDGRTARVRAHLATDGGSPPMKLAYRLRRQEDAWKIIDVSIEGLSLVANYRRYFNRELHKRDLSDVIDKLAVFNRKQAGDFAQNI